MAIQQHVIVEDPQRPILGTNFLIQPIQKHGRIWISRREGEISLCCGIFASVVIPSPQQYELAAAFLLHRQKAGDSCYGRTVT